MRLWIALAIGAVLTVLLVACGDGDGTSASLTASPSPTPIDREALFRAEAAELCPAEFLEPCTDIYVNTALSSLPAAMCVNEDAGTWFFETPGGVPGVITTPKDVKVGDACAGDAAHTVVALINY